MIAITPLERNGFHDEALSSHKVAQSYVFGSFRLDPDRRLLFSSSGIVPLPERVFQLLLVLVQAGGRTVDKDTLVARVWPDQSVTDGNLAQHVYMLRQVLGERARDRWYIVTVSGKGYRLATPVVKKLMRAETPVRENAHPIADGAFEGLDEFRLYCRGSRLLEARTPISIKGAIEAFESSLHLDPTYVPALVGLARAYAFLGEFWHVAPSQAFPKARDAVSRALRLDEESGPAHAVLSEILMFADWDWRGAEAAIETALRLSPASTFVRNNAAWLHVWGGNFDRAVRETRRAILMEPSSPYLQLLMARVLIHARNFPQAISYLTNLLEADPAFYVARRYRAQAYLLANQPEQAIAELLLLPQERSEEPSFRLPMLGRAYAESGDLDRARRIHESLLSMSATDYVVYWNLAISATGIGDYDAALTYLDRAAREREPTVIFLGSLRWFEPLENEPAFRALLRLATPAPVETGETA